MESKWIQLSIGKNKFKSEWKLRLFLLEKNYNGLPHLKKCAALFYTLSNQKYQVKPSDILIFAKTDGLNDLFVELIDKKEIVHNKIKGEVRGMLCIKKPMEYGFKSMAF